MRLFRYEQLAECIPGSTVRLDKEESAHLFRTLRAEPGEKCRLLDGAGRMADAEVLPGKMLRVERLETVPPPEAPLLHMYIAPPRRQKMDQILRQVAELGVWRIVPMLCERSVSLPDSDSVNGRWKEVLFEACKQSGNPFLPQVSAPMKFADALADSGKQCGLRYFGSVMQRQTEETVSGSKAAAWFVGPEGGFTETEEKQMLEAGVQPLHFGNWVLRVETAAVCGLCLIHEMNRH